MASGSSTSKFSTVSLYIILLVLLFKGATANRRVSFGEGCNRTVRCDSRASLTCKSSVCKCIMEDTMTFDTATGRCAVIPGEKCIYTAVESENRNEERTWREEMPCVANAGCQDGFCLCFPGFFENSNGTCSIKRAYLEKCESDTSCMSGQSLYCNHDQRCDCDVTQAIFDISRQTCVRKAGAPCDDYNRCVNNAFCKSEASGAVCDCEDGYFVNSVGSCDRRRGHGESCSKNDHCRHEDYLQYVCNSDGRCGCNVTISFYDKPGNICRRKAGASCEGFPYCVENSECGRNRVYQASNVYPDVTCDCISDHFNSSNGTCVMKRGYGEKCNSDNNCQADLKCGKGRFCECDQTQSVYDPSKKKCVGLSNAPCENDNDCIPNSECEWTGEDERSCNCIEGYTKSVNGSCLVPHNGKCTNHWTSSCSQGLLCHEGTCGCKYGNQQQFNSDMKKCVSNIQGPCSDSISCAENAHCSKSRRCLCNSGFIQVDDKCQLSIGQSCNYLNSEYSKYVACDTLAPLRCIEGTCQCDALQVYDELAMKCLGKVGSLCSLGEGLLSPTAIRCIEGAECRKRRFHSPKDKAIGICECKSDWQMSNDLDCIVDSTRSDVSAEVASREEKYLAV